MFSYVPWLPLWHDKVLHVLGGLVCAVPFLSIYVEAYRRIYQNPDIKEEEVRAFSIWHLRGWAAAWSLFFGGLGFEAFFAYLKYRGITDMHTGPVGDTLLDIWAVWLGALVAGLIFVRPVKLKKE